jgi:hypothetical protein
MTAKVNSSSRIPDPHGDSTIPNTWSAQVIAMKVASMIQMPYRLRKAGTGRFAPTSFWTRSDRAANGHTAHQSRPKNTYAIGISGHHSTHMRAVPALSEALGGPASGS